jgi:hypothetical protein
MIDSGGDDNAALSMNTKSNGRTLIGHPGGGRVCIMCDTPTTEVRSHVVYLFCFIV